MLGELVEVRLEIGAAALLARFDDDDATSVGNAVRLHGLDGAECGEEGVAIIRDAARVEAIAASNRDEGFESFGPVTERGLLVEVSIEHDGGAVARGGVDGDDEGGRATFETMNGHAKTGELASARPRGHQLSGFFEMAVLYPLGVEHGREGRYRAKGRQRVERGTFKVWKEE